MARLIKKRWEGDRQAVSRRDRMPCDYEAYLPDRLAGLELQLDGAVAADVAAAETAITLLNQSGTTLSQTEALARMLLRAEAVASSRIEGLEMGARRLLRAEAAQEAGAEARDVTAREILNNIQAMALATQRVQSGDAISVGVLLEVHTRLLEGTSIASIGGKVRDEQNWIGGTSPCNAAFVPPPAEYVRGLVDDLCEFCNRDDLPPVAQAAIAHTQFETIHPFADGNGRTGRALIHMVLQRRGLVPRSTPPVSLVLATDAKGYIAGLTASRYTGPATSQAARAGLNTWIGFFAGACTRAVADVRTFEANARAVEELWRTSLGRVRAKSAIDVLLPALVGAPVVTVQSAAELIGRGVSQTNEAINRLVEAKVLKQISLGRRNRAFEAPLILDAFTALERRLASPTADTRTAPPTRRVPRRR